MGLTLTQLLPDYRASLNDARLVFGDDAPPALPPVPDVDTPDPGPGTTQLANLTRHLQIAARALAASGKRSRTCLGELTVVAGQARYVDVPGDLLLPKVGLWGINQSCPWELPHGPLPILSLTEADGVPLLVMTPAPSAAQVSAFGTQYAYYYFGAHTVTDDAATSTVAERDRHLLILRAQVEAMRETALRNAHKPVTLRDATSGMSTKNMTPAALYEKLLQEFNESA